MSTSPPLRILVVDDDTVDRLAVRRALLAGGTRVEIEEVDDARPALERLAGASFDCVFLDYYLPGGDGLQVIRGARESGVATPIVLLTGRGDEELAVEAMKAGATDYLSKQALSSDRLAQSLRYALSMERAERQARKAEKALRESRRWLATTLRGIADGVVTTDVEGRITYLNPVAEGLTGWRQGEASGLLVHEVLVVGEETLRRVLRLTSGTGGSDENGRLQLDEETLVARDGAEIPVSLTASTLRDEQNLPIGIVVALRDTTERKLADEALRHYTSQLRGLTDASLAINSSFALQDILQVITDRARQVVGAHIAVTSFTTGQNWRQAVSALAVSDKYAHLSHRGVPEEESGIYALVCERSQTVRFTQVQLEAHEQWPQLAKSPLPRRGWLAAPLVGPDGENLGLIQLTDKVRGDFTEQDETILVQLAQMASVGVVNARLYERLEQAVKARDDLLAVVSHDLRNPLGAIVTNSYLLTDALTGREKGWVESIQRASRQMQRLLDDLLDASRIERGQLSVELGEVDVTELLDDACRLQRTQAELGEVEIICAAGEGVDGLMADRDRLLQVLTNLVGNAVKIVPPGGRITVRAERAGHGVLFSVADTGPGISAEDMPHLFQPFWQSRETKTGGSGLGLAIARGIVEAHGGRIWVDSRPGEGATFSFSVPLASPREAAPVGDDGSLAGRP